MNKRSVVTMVVSLIAAMGLRVAPWPLDLSFYAPDWIVLVIIYWCLAAPERFGVGTAWLVGVVTDVLTGQLLGQHALVYSVVAYVSLKLSRRLRLFPPLKQMVSVLAMLIAAQLLTLWTEQLQGTPYITWVFWIPALTGALVWPLVAALLNRVGRRHEIR